MARLAPIIRAAPTFGESTRWPELSADYTTKIFSNPSDERTEMYVTGRFG